jgi:hypothetical protein
VLTVSVSWLVEQLVAADPAEVERLLRLRADVVLPPVPRDLRELAERLDDPASLSAVLQTAELPALQVAEALQALGGRATVPELADLLDGGTSCAAHLDRVLDWLADRAVLRVCRDSAVPVVIASPALAACFLAPLGVDRPAAELHAMQTAAALRQVVLRLGLLPPTRKADLVATLVGFLSDPEAVRTVAGTAPPEVLEWLARLAVSSPLEDLDDEADLATLYDPVRYDRNIRCEQWAAERGLVVSEGWGGGVRMPAEVALALRGPGYRAPFSPTPPQVPSWSVPAGEVDRESAASAAAFAEQALALLDLLSLTPVPTLKSGGIGARELTRLAKRLGTNDDVVRLALECAAAAGLVRADVEGAVPTSDLATWRDRDPGDRFVSLLRAWWRMGGVPTRAKDGDGRTVAALAHPMSCPSCAAARHALLEALATLGPGNAAQPAVLAGVALWSRPLVHAGSGPDDLSFDLLWREAELLGVVAGGTLSPLGRLLVDDGSAGGKVGAPDPLTVAAGAILPPASEDAVFGGDLTVVAAGAPSARVTRVLDTVADREGRGGAVVWRITPRSIRRALDEGATVDGLERDLTAIARSGLPQPLRYLLRDVARQHGSVRVRDVASCLRGEDPALLVQIAADRSLRRLGLHVLAPTVLASAADARTTVDALRAAGYLPVEEDGEGVPVLGGRPRPSAPERTASRVRRPPPRRSTGDRDHRATAPVTDVAELARVLVRAGDPGTPQPASPTEAQIREQAPRLPAGQARLLGHAVDAGLDVVIQYVAASGGRTRRQVGEMALLGSVLQAWCHLRQDERFFTLARIESVEPVASRG